MPSEQEITHWENKIRTRYKNYLKTSFYFKDPELRKSFDQQLENYELMKGGFPELAKGFLTGNDAHYWANKFFTTPTDILPALISDYSLYDHQEQAIRKVHGQQENVVIATGTASGKTESFLYPILFHLYQQYLDGKLDEPGVRALILYPMNALANDQRRRLGKICEKLEDENSDFKPTFGQYIGATPEDEKDDWRNAKSHIKNKHPGEIIFRKEMRAKPPHILLTNYSMLEYLLIRPEDSKLFDNGRGQHWKFVVLDEAHQYRGAKGMEMGMLVRRLKQRLRDGGRTQPFKCIATSATISSGEGQEDKKAVVDFAENLFGEPFATKNIIFGNRQPSDDTKPQRFHLFMRALEGAFLSCQNGKNTVVLNRNTETDNEQEVKAIEIALCRECGQHYYVGREESGYLIEAIRDPSHSDFGVDFYLPIGNDTDSTKTHRLCRQCGKLSNEKESPDCKCGATISVKKCDNHAEHLDRLKKCEVCDYTRGGVGDPVQEIVHGTDGPNSVIATALHGLLPEKSKKILSFADSRQEAAFFAWYAEDSYEKVRDRNFILRALKENSIDSEGLSVKDLQKRLNNVYEANRIFPGNATPEEKNSEVTHTIFRELVTNERRISLEGTGLVKWSVKIPNKLKLPDLIYQAPWNFSKDEGRELLNFLLNRLRYERAVTLPQNPTWSEVSSFPRQAVTSGTGKSKENIFSWGTKRGGIVSHFLCRLHQDKDGEILEDSEILIKALWDCVTDYNENVSDEDKLFVDARRNGTFWLNHAWLRVNFPSPDDCFECGTCARLSFYNLRGVCPRSSCPGSLAAANPGKLKENHYRDLYVDENMPAKLRAEEHTAQLESEEAQKRQQEFMNGEINLLSSSTTFEVGVDLGDLEAVFLRNVPPEPFNYTQRVGRAGRREGAPGLALTYCRRNPHDLYHYTDPKNHLLEGKVRPPQLHMNNEKIILRHITATALALFFKAHEHRDRFSKVENLIGGDWKKPNTIAAFNQFCRSSTELKKSLSRIVPDNMHDKTGIVNDNWVDRISGEDSRLANAVAEVCSEYQLFADLKDKYGKLEDFSIAEKFKKRAHTIAVERTLNFLSRKAIIPKYGFPVDVVELDTRPQGKQKISLQRDLSQAIAEYAPGAKVVANKEERTPYGIKIVRGKILNIKHYHYNKARDFKQWSEGDNDIPMEARPHKYLSPEFGFVTSLLEKPKKPQGRAGRLYTTRPFFKGFTEAPQDTKKFYDVEITPALPGEMVVLCEGKTRNGFYICLGCGAGFAGKKSKHKTPEGTDCRGTLDKFSLGHEFVTDVVRLQFPKLKDEWEAYSLAYAVLLGAAQRLNVPNTDLSTTITAGNGNKTAIVLYDNVPGGAGLVGSLYNEKVFADVLEEAKNRVDGNCECTESCYGCLRSYRNQFAHPHLRRKDALKFLKAALETGRT